MISVFEKSHIKRAKELALAGYNAERTVVSVLPQVTSLPDKIFEDFADTSFGVVMFDGDKMLGFMCWEHPWDNAYDSTAKGVFVPIHAHGTVPENRERIYKRLYQAAAEIWVDNGITYHIVSLYAHDLQAKEAFFSCGFGLRCVDAVRPLANFEHPVCESITFEELVSPDSVKEVRHMKNALSVHLGESPVFMRGTTPEARESWIERTESRGSRLFAARHNNLPVAYIEVLNDGENFATEQPDMKNICGAFCLPEYRGKGIMEGLLNYVIDQFKTGDVTCLGVDFESFNLTASGFWLKHFTAYTHSVTRRIDECALKRS
jgi:GNAT superfamily N-acetyltransferase